MCHLQRTIIDYCGIKRMEFEYHSNELKVLSFDVWLSIYSTIPEMSFLSIKWMADNAEVLLLCLAVLAHSVCMTINTNLSCIECEVCLNTWISWCNWVKYSYIMHTSSAIVVSWLVSTTTVELFTVSYKYLVAKLRNVFGSVRHIGSLRNRCKGRQQQI